MNKQKVFIAVSLLLIAVVTGGIVINQQLNKVLISINNIPVPTSESEPGDRNLSPAEENNHQDVTNNRDNYQAPHQYTGDSSNISQADLMAAVQSQIPITKTDMATIGIILLRNLSWDEITWIYQIAQGKITDKEEKARAKELLQMRLNDEDKKTIREIGSKYGQRLSFLAL